MGKSDSYKHKKRVRRIKSYREKRKGFERYVRVLRKNGLQDDEEFVKPEFPFSKPIPGPGKKPTLSDNVKYLATIIDAFAGLNVVYQGFSEEIVIQVPAVFSLTEKGAEDSYIFLKRLFDVLEHQKAERVRIDYESCERIDVDASMCMDIILSEFIHFYSRCRRGKYKVKVKSIRPINFENKPNIERILFSIGSLSYIKGLTRVFPDIEPFPISVGDKKRKDSSSKTEIHITQMVDYVLRCLKRMNHTLTWQAENSLSKVIGEVMINAEEHSNTSRRYAVGYFQETHENDQHVGVFNLAILNFGRTIYDSFKDPNCPNQEVVRQMHDLSDAYTQKGFFTPAQFEEQTLWTLYALQQGVTRKTHWKRGNGSIQFIESFFKLKGDMKHDNLSRLSIVSGNTRILFDGTYRIVERQRGPKKEWYKMITFNNSGSIEEQPDEKYVTFAPYFLPGTIISARIGINYNSIEEQ